MVRKPRIQKILVATDLSETATHALAYAASLAEAYQGAVTVLHVIEKLPPNAELLLTAFLGLGDVSELRRQNQETLIARIKAAIEHFCAEAGGQIAACRFILQEVIVEPGKAADRILHHAAAGGYDLLVVGNRGHGLVQETLMGGTSRKVVRDCPIPVLVIPAAP
jgi:nucleotide-binding universal stress UspA family protein